MSGGVAISWEDFGSRCTIEFRGVQLPLMPRVMLLLDLESDCVYGKLGVCEILMSYLLTTATLLIAKRKEKEDWWGTRYQWMIQ